MFFHPIFSCQPFIVGYEEHPNEFVALLVVVFHVHEKLVK